MNLLDVLNSPWAILPEKLEEIQSVYERRVLGEAIDLAAVEAALGRPLANNQPKGYDLVDGVAVVQMNGAVAKRANLFSSISGGASLEIIGNAIAHAMDNDDVRAVVLAIDSPGGTVSGTQELARQIHSYRGRKPMEAFANGTIASAAYWIGSAMDKVYISGDTTTVGSIGVVASHVDISKRQEMAGVKTTEIFAGKYKRIASQYEPLTKEGKAAIQNQVDYLYSVFVNDVAMFRGQSVETVLADMADARLFIGAQAVEAGLVDGITTLGSMVSRLSVGNAIINGEMAVAGTENTVDTAAIEKQIAAARAEGVAEGRAAELARVQSILEISVDGYSDLIGAAINDGKSTAADVALSIVKVQKERGVSLAALKADAPAALPYAGEPEPDEAAEEASLAKMIAQGAE